MRTLTLKNLFALFLLVAVCAAAAQGQRRRRGGAGQGPPARLTAMKIFQYNGMSDTMSGDVADAGEALFNDLDISLLVKVEVSGKAGEFSSRTVEITARQGNKVVLNRTSMVGIYNESGKYYATAWVYGPICQDTVIQARLLGQRQPSVIRKTIGANCGE